MSNIIIVSFFVYLFVNFFENMIHYNIGKHSNKEFKMEVPTRKDFVRIFVVMCMFALLQGLLEYLFIH
jgi:hypothetical protein